MTQFFSESDTLIKSLKTLVLLACLGSDVVILTNVTPLLEIASKIIKKINNILTFSNNTFLLVAFLVANEILKKFENIDVLLYNNR